MCLCMGNVGSHDSTHTSGTSWGMSFTDCHAAMTEPSYLMYYAVARETKSVNVILYFIFDNKLTAKHKQDVLSLHTNKARRRSSYNLK